MRLILILLSALWAVGAIFAFVTTREKTSDARLTTAYLILWPAALVLTYLNSPLPLWVMVPVMFGFIPWFLAGPHLWGILKDPSRTRADELVGVPVAYWKWGGAAALVLGLLADWLVRP